MKSESTFGSAPNQSKPRSLWALPATVGLVLMLVATGIWAVVIALQQSASSGVALQRFVSVPLDASGTRLECQHPVGWKVVYIDQISPRGTGLGTTCVVIESVDQYAKLRQWLQPIRQALPVNYRRLLDKEGGSVVLSAHPVASSVKPTLGGKVRVERYSRWSSAHRSIVSKDGRYVLEINYARTAIRAPLGSSVSVMTPSDQSAFQSTYGPVMQSLKKWEAGTGTP
ncbi:MAG: hypothetical protein V4671_11050 [Armatimonadota bacterium]